MKKFYKDALKGLDKDTLKEFRDSFPAFDRFMLAIIIAVIIGLITATTSIVDASVNHAPTDHVTITQVEHFHR